ncbi:hypothetical protein D3C80_1865580 [compost metagenome]
MRQRQDVHRNVRVAVLEAAHLCSDEVRAETFGGTDAQMPGQRQAGARNLLAGGLQGALQRLGVAQQALPLRRQHESGIA